MTAAEIAKEANIPRTSVYDILKSFTEKGICNEIETPTKLRYEMIDPDVVEAKLRNDFKRTHNTKLDELSASFSKLKGLYKVKGLPEKKVKIELLRGFNKHRELKFLNLLKDSKKDILVTNRIESGLVSDEQSDEVKKFIGEGGILKTIYEINTNFKVKVNNKWVDVDMPKLVDLCESFEEQGENVRLAKEIPQNYTIFDSKIVFLNLIDETIKKNNRSDIIIRDTRYAHMMVDLFNFYWDNSMTVKEFKETLK
jgi:sugar-specific transcriptional regulator TrmB